MGLQLRKRLHGGKGDNGERMSITGWALLFHPDLLHGFPLERHIRGYSFFDYRVNEALHMTDEEHDIGARHHGIADTAGNHIRRFVIQLAKNGLASGETVSQVSDRLGFEYTQHFSRMFKKSEGITPSEYRQRLHSR